DRRRRGGDRTAPRPPGSRPDDGGGCDPDLRSERRPLRPDALRGALGADPVDLARPADPRRRVHVLYRQDDPGLRGVERGAHGDQPVQPASDGGSAMSMTTTVAPVRVASGTLADDWRAVKVVWKRELIRFRRNKPRIVTSLAQPVLFLFVLGGGLAHLIPGA